MVQWRHLCLIGLAACPAAGLSGCLGHPSAAEGGFDSPNPQARVYAITDAARQGSADEATLRSLIETLESDDPLVRMMAITTLQQLTGESRGYRHYDSPVRRRIAIESWKDYLGGDTLEPSAPAPTAGEAIPDEDEVNRP